MGRFARCLALVVMVTVGSLALPGDAHAQYPVAVTAVQPVVPTAVVGYTAERRGLFGWRVVYRPIVAPVAAAVPVTTTVSVAKPIVSAPVTVGYAPYETPVTSYYAPSVPIAAPPVPVAVPVVPPITTLRVPVPVPVVTPYIGY